jgi:hypothetical protein
MGKSGLNKYYNEYGVALDGRIAYELTFFFEERKAADAKAWEMRSYVYQVFDHNNRHCGYAVPK